MYCFVILLLFNEMQMSVRRFSAIPHLRECMAPTQTLKVDFTILQSKENTYFHKIPRVVFNLKL